MFLKSLRKLNITVYLLKAIFLNNTINVSIIPKADFKFIPVIILQNMLCSTDIRYEHTQLYEFINDYIIFSLNLFVL